MLFCYASHLLPAGKAALFEEPPIPGGVTDGSDDSVPKEIQSREITSFRTWFFVYDRDGRAERSGRYEFELARNEQDELVLTASGVYEHELAVDAAVLEGVQQIVEQYNLIQNNGAGRITAGLPPEFEPWLLDVHYASGETLYFYENGRPDADWTLGLARLFSLPHGRGGL